MKPSSLSVHPLSRNSRSIVGALIGAVVFYALLRLTDGDRSPTESIVTLPGYLIWQVVVFVVGQEWSPVIPGIGWLTIYAVAGLPFILLSAYIGAGHKRRAIIIVIYFVSLAILLSPLFILFAP